MLETTEFIAETIMIATAATPFDDALEDLRISGNVILHELYAPPWAINVPDEAAIRKTLGVGDAARALPFHLVRAGAFDLSCDGGAPARVEAGEVAICMSGAPHRMSFGEGAQAVPLAQILERGPQRGGDARVATELLCGIFLLRGTPLNPLLAARPPVLKIDTAGASASPSLSFAVDMLAAEVKDQRRNSFTASRLLEIFCAEAIGAYRRSAEARRCGWFSALDDEKIGRAMRRLHENPGAPWSVAALAEVAAMSPSRFAARFREVMGQSAMSYVAAWRMNVACRLLRETPAPLMSIAAEIGYGDVAAFSRAFKALVGKSPAIWRASTESRELERA